jgi:hypothetical protein
MALTDVPLGSGTGTQRDEPDPSGTGQVCTAGGGRGEYGGERTAAGTHPHGGVGAAPFGAQEKKRK